MRLLLVAVCLAIFFGVDARLPFMTKRVLQANYTRCFPKQSSEREKLILSQKAPQGFTINTFLSKVERMEKAFPEDSAVNMALRLLLYFSYDYYKYPINGNGNNFNDVVGDEEDSDKIKRFRDKFLKELADSNNIEYDENVKQRMKYYLDDDDICYLVRVISSSLYARDFPRDGKNISETSYELGVLSLHPSEKSSAVSIGRVLYGIVAPDKEISLLDLTGRPAQEVGNGDIASTPVKYAYGLTVGEIIGGAVVVQTQTKTFLAKGEWNDTGCQISFAPRSENDKKPSIGTVAHAFGAFDGLLLFKAVHKEQILSESFKLSQLLRAYYSTSGFNTATDKYGVCQRKPLLENDENLRKQVNAMAGAQYLHDGSEDNWEDAAKRITDKPFSDAISSTVNSCPQDPVTSFPCETPSNVLVILDTSSEGMKDENIQLQSKIISNIVNRMKFIGDAAKVRTYASSVESINNVQVLKLIKDGDSCPGCSLYFKEGYEISVTGTSPTEVFKALNGTLKEMDALGMDEQPKSANASRVVFYFNLQDLPSVDDDTVHYVNLIKALHPETKIFAVGKKNYLDKLQEKTKGFRMVLDISTVQDNTFKDILNSACQVPALLQYPECLDRSKESSNKFEGFISQGTTQYWAFYPKYFHGSGKLTITFEGKDQNENIFVCEASENFNRDPTGCDRKLENNKREFVYYNPCKGGPTTCEPLVFQITGAKDIITTPATGCNEDSLCQHPYQIPFTVTHTGMYCTGCMSAIFSPFTLLVTLLAIFRYHV